MESDDPLSDIDVNIPHSHGILLSRCINCGRVLHRLALFCKCNPDEIAETRITCKIVNCDVCDRELPDHRDLCPAEGKVPDEYEVREGGRIILAKYDEFLRENGVESDEESTYPMDSDSEDDFESEEEYVYERDLESEEEGGNHYLRRSNRVYAGLGDIFNDDDDEEDDEEEEEYDFDYDAFLHLVMEITRPFPCVKSHPTDRPVRQ